MRNRLAVVIGLSVVAAAACEESSSGKPADTVDSGSAFFDALVFGQDAVSPDAAVPDTAVPDAASPDVAADAPVLAPGALPAKPYLGHADSPFAGVDFVYFHLEDVEDHMINTPGLGVMAGGRASSTFGAGVIDSVDEDDGNGTDGVCKVTMNTCDAWWGPGALTFTFDGAALGGLPTHVGAVWTDGQGQVSFEAFGPGGESLYKFGPFSEPGFPDNTVSSSTAEDRFFGAYSPGGIAAIKVSNTAGGVEVDHIQYGRAR
jgi:hypothetical protein